MNKMVFFFLVTFLGITHIVNGQSSEKYNYYISGHGGAAQAFGDVQEYREHISKFKGETDIAYGIRLAKYVSPVYAVHLQYIMGGMKGERAARDFTFSTKFKNIQLGATANLSSIIMGENPNRKFVIYGLTGISLMLYNTDVKNISTGSYVDEQGNPISDASAKKGTALGFPIGAGISYNFSNNFSVNFGTTLNLLDNDRLDGIISGKRNDAFYYTNLGLTYNFMERPPEPLVIDTEPLLTSEDIPLDTTSLVLKDKGINIEYILPDHIYSQETFEFQCLIHKKGFSGKAELMQILPIGLNLTDSIFDGATRYNLQNYILKLYWDDLSEDSIITINYHAQLDDIFGYLPITSVLYLEETGSEYTFDTNIFIEKEVQKPLDLIVANDNETTETTEAFETIDQQQGEDSEELDNSIVSQTENNNSEIEGTNTSAIISGEIVTNANTNSEETPTQENQDEHIVIEDIEYTEDEIPTNPIVSDEQEQQTSSAQWDSDAKVEYRVQIRAAYQAKCSIDNLTRKYNITNAIQEDYVGNWYRYSIGSFGSFSEAKEYRREVINQNGVLDAFIVAFKNGVRLNSLSEIKDLTSNIQNDTKYSETGRTYRVQIMALLHHQINPEDLQNAYNISNNISEETYGQWRKYVVGNTSSLEEAKVLLQNMKDAGISDAFIVIYDEGSRLNVFGI